MSERERRLDNIRKYAEQIDRVSKGYQSLLFMAEREKWSIGGKEPCSDAFLCLAEAAGKMTLSSMDQLATLLEILWKVGGRDERKPEGEEEL